MQSNTDMADLSIWKVNWVKTFYDYNDKRKKEREEKRKKRHLLANDQTRYLSSP